MVLVGEVMAVRVLSMAVRILAGSFAMAVRILVRILSRDSRDLLLTG